MEEIKQVFGMNPEFQCRDVSILEAILAFFGYQDFRRSGNKVLLDHKIFQKLPFFESGP